MSGKNDEIRENYKQLCENVKNACERSGRNYDEVSLVAVSKFQPVDKIKVLHELGVYSFGESYLNEAMVKISELKAYNDMNWHYIGRIQTKKINKILTSFSLIESVESIEMLKEISQRAERLEQHTKVLLQVNIGEESSKSGFYPEELSKIQKSVASLKRINIRGLMCLPPFTDDIELKRGYFKSMRALKESLASTLPPTVAPSFAELSMGTSHDYEIAVEEGATLIRVGTSLFGERAN